MKNRAKNSKQLLPILVQHRVQHSDRDEQSVGPEAADRVVPEGKVNWRRAI